MQLGSLSRGWLRCRYPLTSMSPARSPKSATNTGKRFEEYVHQLLRLSGYSVQRDCLVDGTQIDAVATRADTLAPIRYLVECADHTRPTSIAYVKEKAGVLLGIDQSRALTLLIVVARNGFSAEARAFAADKPQLLLRSVSELEAGLVDFAPYRAAYTQSYQAASGRFKEANLAAHYVELTVRHMDGHTAPISEAISSWLLEPENNVVFLLGDYGAGKTSFLRHFTFELLSGHLTPDVLPVLIPLRDFRTAVNLRQVITDTLVNDYGVRLSPSRRLSVIVRWAESCSCSTVSTKWPPRLTP